MKLEKNEFTTDSLIEYLKKTYGQKVTGEDFNKNDVSQYLGRGMIPYRYGGNKISSKKEKGVRIITMEKK
jgi:hypothetical protein